MIKKLKYKYIITCMSLVTTVLLFVFAAVLVSTYRSSVKNIQDGLNETNKQQEFELFHYNGLFDDDSNTDNNSDNNHNPNDESNLTDSKPSDNNANKEKPDDTPLQIGGFKDDRGKKPFSISSVTVILDSDNNIIDTYENRASMEDEILEKAVSLAVNSEKRDGLLSSIGLFFRKSTTNDKLIISFADSSEFESTITHTVIVSLIVGLISLLALFIISLFLARMAIKPVEHAWEQQQQFVADASHELKTPLTVILANNNILQKHPDDTLNAQKKWIESTQEEALHMKKLVDDLLYLAKSDAGKTPCIFENVDYSDIAMSTLLQFEPIAFEKNISIDSNIVSDIYLSGDTTKLKQLIHILLDNACKYSPSGGTVFLTLCKHQHTILLKVNNSGGIISTDDIGHLFERFYRSDKARQREGGAGLGLSIAKSIVDEHKGTILVESNHETGTTFIVKFA